MIVSCLDAPVEAPAWSKPWRSETPPTFSYTTDEVDAIGAGSELSDSAAVSSGKFSIMTFIRSSGVSLILVHSGIWLMIIFS